jgi:hypothetical protein
LHIKLQPRKLKDKNCAFSFVAIFTMLLLVNNKKIMLGVKDEKIVRRTQHQFIFYRLHRRKTARENTVSSMWEDCR